MSDIIDQLLIYINSLSFQLISHLSSSLSSRYLFRAFCLMAIFFLKAVAKSSLSTVSIDDKSMLTPPFSFVSTCLSFMLLFLIYSSKFDRVFLLNEILLFGDKIGGGGGGGGNCSMAFCWHYYKYSFYCFSCSLINSIIWGCGFYIAYFFNWWMTKSVAIIFIRSLFDLSFSLRPNLSIKSTSKGDLPSYIRFPPASILVT